MQDKFKAQYLTQYKKWIYLCDSDQFQDMS